MSLENNSIIRKKILHLIDSPGIYGAEVMLLALISQQKMFGILPILGSFYYANEPERDIELLAKNSKIQVKRFSTSKGISLRNGFKVIQWAKKNNIDIIHIHSVKQNIQIALIPKKWRKIPIIRTLHGWINTTRFSKAGVYQALDMLCLRFTDRIYTVSGAMLTKPPLLGSSLKVEVIENGILEPQFNKGACYIEKEDPIYNFCDRSHLLLSIGRLSEEKGFVNLIKAIHLLISNGIRVKLCIIGDGPQRRQLEKLINQLNLNDIVLLSGYRKNAFRFMSIFDIYILSSFTEGLPITVLEAMHMGIPIVATQVGGVPEVLEWGESGLLLSSNNPKEICRHLQEILNDKKKQRQLVDKARQRAVNVYSATIMTQKYNNAYEELLTAQSIMSNYSA
jgi:glycosyltransferase involved in cell wall biosynthesis